MGKPMDRSKLAFIPPPLGPFEEAYPQLESAEVEFVEYDLGLLSRRDKWRDSDLMPCNNRACKGGGYLFDCDFHRMIREHQTEKTIEARCGGKVSTFRGGRRTSTQCEFHLEGTIKLKYKPVVAENEMLKKKELGPDYRQGGR
jgi:hypothetical protein